MAKKKKGKGKKSKKPSKSPEEQQAEAEAKARADELLERTLEFEHEEALLNEYQLQKERLMKFWELSKKKREQYNRQLRSKTRRMRNLEEKQRFEMKMYKEKIKHLLHEQAETVVEDQIGGQRHLKIEQKSNRDICRTENKDTRLVKVSQKSAENDVNKYFNRLRLEHQKKVMSLRDEYEHKQNDLIMQNRQSMARLRKEAIEKRRQEVDLIVKLKDKHIESLKKKHKDVFDDIKTYYRDVTILNLELIKSHKDQVGEMKQIEQQLSKEARTSTNKNKKLSLPMRTNRKLALKLKADWEVYKQEKVLLNEKLDHIHNIEAKIKDKEWEKEIIEQKMLEVAAKREKLDKKLATTIAAVQQKAGFKNLLLEKKIQSLASDIETTDAAIKEVLNSTNLPPEVTGNLQFTIEDVLVNKTKKIQSLRDERIQLRKAYYDTIKTYEALFKRYDVPLEELGFTPAAI